MRDSLGDKIHVVTHVSQDGYHTYTTVLYADTDFDKCLYFCKMYSPSLEVLVNEETLSGETFLHIETIDTMKNMGDAIDLDKLRQEYIAGKISDLELQISQLRD